VVPVMLLNEGKGFVLEDGYYGQAVGQMLNFFLLDIVLRFMSLPNYQFPEFSGLVLICVPVILGFG